MNIPQELIDKIIDGIWDSDDSPSHSVTKAASLISRAWVERSQHHLFRDIQFSFYDDHFVRWCDAISPGPDGVSRHVRSLTIRARGPDGWWIDGASLERSLPYFDSFRNVRVLRVHNWDIEPFPPEVLTRCFIPFAGCVRNLQWDPHVHTTREAWTRIVGLFPLVDYLLLFPNFFPTGLLSGAHAGPSRKKLVLSGGRAAQCLAWGGGSLRFREIYIRCSTETALETVAAIVNRDAEWLEILSIAAIRRVIADGSNPHVRALASLLSSCRALHELSMDWLPADVTPELQLIDAIPVGCIQSLRIIPDRVHWRYVWGGLPWVLSSSSLIPPYEKLAQAILRLGMRYSKRKISVWFVVPRVPYVICDPVRECVVALWERVEGAVSFGFQMTEAEPRNFGQGHPTINPA